MMKSPYSKPPRDDGGDPPMMTCDIRHPMEVETAKNIEVEMCKTSACPMAVTPPCPTWKNAAAGASSTLKLASTAPKSFKDALI
ncbi:hypothetical protein U1Q18_027794 [Sarracenia purpurea var. burkii]